MWRLLARLDRIHRKVIYVILLVAAAIPFFFDIRLPLYIWDDTRTIHELTDTCPKDKVVVICSNWDPGSQSENWPQYESVVSHCMMKGIKLVVFSLDSNVIAPQMAETINEKQAALYGRHYGVDWVNLGFTRGAPLMMGTIGRNIKSAYPTDYKGSATNDYGKLPIMKNVNSCKDFRIIYLIEYQATNDWMVWLDPTGSTPIVYASAGIVSGNWYPYIQSGQIKGMMAGIRGAAEYEQLTDEKYGERYKGRKDLRGGKMIVPLAFGYLVIIMFIVIGNVGTIAVKKLKGSAK
jgi:hypothetical protein